METLTHTVALQPVPLEPGCAEVPLVIFSAVDEAWNTTTARWLAARNVPIVLVSRRSADEVLAAQTALGTRHPFVCDGGAALYVPTGYFPELTRIGSVREGWNCVEFKAPYDTGHAVRLLASLYRVCNERAVIVALAQQWGDRVLLQEADVPVVVRDGDVDQMRLLDCVPSAYLTSASGLAGWGEAVQGTLRE
jgi:predicted mannosyl-3-phosphoglycerate phosphatase (HAD superfamily)